MKYFSQNPHQNFQTFPWFDRTGWTPPGSVGPSSFLTTYNDKMKFEVWRCNKKCYSIPFYYIFFCYISYYSNLFQSILSHFFLIFVVYSILRSPALFYSLLSYPMIWYPVLFYSILFYSILFYSILFYSILFYSTAFYSILSYNTLS